MVEPSTAIAARKSSRRTIPAWVRRRATMRGEKISGSALERCALAALLLHTELGARTGGRTTAMMDGMMGGMMGWGILVVVLLIAILGVLAAILLRQRKP